MQFPQLTKATPAIAPEQALIPVPAADAIVEDTLSGFAGIFDLLTDEAALAPDGAAASVPSNWPPLINAVPPPMARDVVLPDVSAVPEKKLHSVVIDPQLVHSGGAAMQVPVTGDKVVAAAAPIVPDGSAVLVASGDPAISADSVPVEGAPRKDRLDHFGAPVSALSGPPMPNLLAKIAPQPRPDTAKPAPASAPIDPNRSSTSALVDLHMSEVLARKTPAPALERPSPHTQLSPAPQGRAADPAIQLVLLSNDPPSPRDRSGAVLEAIPSAAAIPAMIKAVPMREAGGPPVKSEAAPLADAPILTPISDASPLPPLAPAPPAATPIQNQSAPFGQSVAQQVTQAVQIALQSVQSPAGDRVELSLAPEELGRIQFDLATKGDALRLVVYVERPETLDLIRRHADQLLTDLRNAGFGQTTLDMGGWGQRDQPPTTEPVEPRPGSVFSEGLVAQLVQTHTLAPVDGRLDLRL